MGKLTAAIYDELTAYFTAPATAPTGIGAQTYEPHASVAYSPVTDTRLVRLVHVSRSIGTTAWARVQRVVDELPAAQVEVLRLACAAPSEGYPLVAARLPSALAQGRVLAESMAVELRLEAAYNAARRDGASGMVVACRVLERERELRLRAVRVSEADVRDATLRAVLHDVIDVADEANAVVDQAVDAYVAARERTRATKRAFRADVAKARVALLDELLGKKRRKATARFEARLRTRTA